MAFNFWIFLIYSNCLKTSNFELLIKYHIKEFDLEMIPKTFYRTEFGRVFGNPINVLILDEVINSYFSILELISEWIEGLENGVVTDPKRYHLRRVQLIKRKLTYLRRSSWRLREIVREILSSEYLSTSEELYRYIQDLYDNVLEVVDIAESCRERIADLLNMYLTSISNRLNEIMKA